MVDIEPVWLVGNGDHVRAQLAEHVRRDLVGRAVGAIHHDLKPFQADTTRKSAFAKFHIAASGVVVTLDLAERARLDRAHRFVHGVFDGRLDRVGELATVRGKELDAVVGIRIVRSADDDTGTRPRGDGKISDARRGHRPEQTYVHAGRAQPGLERRFQEIARHARILADDDLGVIRTVLAEHSTGRPTELHHRLGCNRLNANLAADAVGAEITLCHP